jgi:hypothetical protein
MNFECTDIVQDVADCDVCWCYENGGCACCCCMVCHDAEDPLYDDDVLRRAYAKKS